jgi:hypothetical protein
LRLVAVEQTLIEFGQRVRWPRIVAAAVVRMAATPAAGDGGGVQKLWSRRQSWSGV